MSKSKLIINGILTFLTSIFVVLFLIMLLIKITFFDKTYVKNVLKDTNYYEEVSEKIQENIEDYIRSSGFPNTILEDIYTKEEVKNDIDSFINMIYIGEVNEFDNNKIKERLSSNIDNYLKENKLEVEDKESLNSFVDEIAEIYKNEIRFHDLINDFFKYVPKLSKFLKVATLVVLTIMVLLIIALLLFKFRYYGSIFLSSGLMLLFVRIVIYSKIDFNNLVIFSNSFSKVLQNILNYIATSMIIFASVVLGVGIVLSLIEAVYRAKKRRKKRL